MLRQIISETIHETIQHVLSLIPEWVNFGARGVAVAIAATLLGFFFPAVRSLMGAIVLADAAFFWGYWMRAF